MSRIGKAPVSIPKGVKASVSGRTLAVEGPLGKLEHSVHPAVSVEVDAPAGVIKVLRDGDARIARSVHGLTRALAANMVEGVSKGFEKKLEIVGVGYLAAKKYKQDVPTQVAAATLGYVGGLMITKYMTKEKEEAAKIAYADNVRWYNPFSWFAA